MKELENVHLLRDGHHWRIKIDRIPYDLPQDFLRHRPRKKRRGNPVAQFREGPLPPVSPECSVHYRHAFRHVEPVVGRQ